MSLAPYLLMTKGPELVLEAFRFQVEGTSDPDALVPYQQGVTNVTRSSIGLFAITLATKYPTLISCVGSVQAAAASGGDTVGLHVYPVSYTASTGVLVVRVENHAGAADDPTDEDWVHVQAVFCRRSGMAPSGAI